MPKIKREQAKDFKSAIKRLFKEMKSFKYLIYLSVILSFLGAALSIMTPSKLSDLVDKISAGLVVNTKNIETITESITNNMTTIDINNILTNNNLTNEDLLELSKLENIDYTNKLELFNYISTLSESLLNKIIPSITIDKETISGYEQINFLKILSSIDKSNVTSMYSKIDELPDNIKTLISPSMDMISIKNITFLLFSLYLLSALFNYLESIIMANVSNNFAKSLRENISLKINKLPLKYFDKSQVGDTLSRVTNDVDTIEAGMDESLSGIVSAIALLIGTILMMFITNWIMAITAISASVIGFLFMAKILSKSQKYHNQRQKYLGEINGHIEEIYSGLNIVKLYNGKEQVTSEFDKINESLYNANKKGQFLSALIMPMMSFIGNFGYVAVCLVGALLTFNGNITFGVIVAFITYVRLFNSPLTQIGSSITSLQSAAAAGERVFEFLDEEEMSSEKDIIKVLNKSKVKGNIIFDNVTFTYDGNESPTIKNFSATVKPGQKIAIVGPTGAGKTTMVNLLMKFYNISSGDIIIDGISIHELSRENIHSLFTMVLQDTWVFEGTVKENIVYNQKDVPNELVHDTCKLVGLDHFINTLPHGYDSKISENDNISSGQRQLLTIARGMIEDSPFLILDEATSNVDTRTEELVANAMDKLCEGRTSFIIAHRLSTIKNADLILVMKDGNIVEQGNHKELIEKNGFYAELYNSQFEL